VVAVGYLICISCAFEMSDLESKAPGERSGQYSEHYITNCLAASASRARKYFQNFVGQGVAEIDIVSCGEMDPVKTVR
jgi:hypothetical protein